MTAMVTGVHGHWMLILRAHPWLASALIISQWLTISRRPHLAANLTTGDVGMGGAVRQDATTTILTKLPNNDRLMILVKASAWP